MKMPSTRQAATWGAQGVLYAAFAGFLALFSSWPDFRSLQPDEGLITISIAHHGQRLQPCREQSLEELARLPPNMRVASRCPRERAPLLVEVDIDGTTVLRQRAEASGLSRDGAGKLYRRMPMPVGVHQVRVRLRDSNRSEGFDYVREEQVELRPAEILVVDFDSEQREFTFK
ncbi:hypothetical protein [Thermomonas sp.]|uniref:hypothetical protein n=2 Tax=Thermomonas sp. TaxID=1971895 RepID=UPI001B761961|nr:hypothetical protein [Thermomonas sp.]MBK6332316.1 hypothetical protein [Thermomonas sp.]MBK6417066.1 hypothetical protein [Thermomonas sp.]MBK6924298.1 hypothetical protein [Thermomonas sp.]MBK7204650.1 hypothetical protein [Thermomonas sp.]MBL0227082.1 hypothetical protein [Thermomonas sp.]